MGTEHDMQFGVLGPLQMSIDSTPIPVGTPKQRAVLAMLITNPNRAVSAADLIKGKKSLQQRLVSQTEVVATASAEATRLVDSAHAEADRLRGECDIYVDSKLAEFEEYLNGTLRSVGRGRHQLRTAAGTHDYVSR